jgi:signal transduction histidine kinase
MLTLKRDSLRLRLIAMAVLWCAIALVAAWALLSALFADQVRRGFDDSLSAQLAGVIAASDWDDAGAASLRRPLPDPRFQQPLSGWYWQISDTGGPVLRSRSLWDGALPVADLDISGSGTFFLDIVGPNGGRLRLAARRLTIADVEGTYLFQLAGDRSAGAADIARFEGLLAAALAILGLGLIGAMVLQVHIGLRPLARIGRALGDIRAGRADRLAGAFPSEIQPLADEIDTLLGHQAAVISRARTHAGDLAHALKTPLAVLSNEAANDTGALADQVRHSVVEMQRQVDRHLSRARTAASAGVLGARCDVTPVLSDLARVLTRLNQDRGIVITIEDHPSMAFAGEQEDLQEMLGNLLENACQWAAGKVRISLAQQGRRIVIQIDDDGPGLPMEARDEVLARGARLDESKPGTGLGLAIVADMAGLYQGSLSLHDSDLGGLSARLTLPAPA